VWFAEISKTANLNPRISEERMTLNGLPRLRVRYRTASGDTQAVYVFSGFETFAIQFGDGSPGVAPEKLSNYSTYLKMLSTFRVMR
jgi:hypothetical protein